ncbi:MAG: MFS transporter [Cyanobacteria bacterium P01_F01_bin.86]
MQYPWRDSKLLVLLATGSLIVMTGAVIAPILPKMIQQLSLDPAVAGYLVSAHYLTVALFSPLLGILADRTGAVRVLVTSLLLYAVFGAAGGILHDFVPILITRVLVGAASGGIAAASLGLLVRRYEAEAVRSQAIAYVATVLTLANIFYPVLAGLIGNWNWRWVFALYGLGIPLALLVVVNWRNDQEQGRRGRKSDEENDATSDVASQPETQNVDVQPPTDSRRPPKLLDVVCRWYPLQLYATQCLVAAIAHATIIYLPLYLKATLNAGTLLIGLVLAAQGLGAAAIAAFGVRRLGQRFGLDRATSLGLGIMALILTTIPQLQQLPTILPCVILFGVGLGIVVPSLYNLMSNLAPSGLQSTVLAIGVGSNFLGQFISPGVFGFVLSWQGLPPVFYGAAVMALMLGIWLVGVRGDGVRGDGVMG